MCLQCRAVVAILFFAFSGTWLARAPATNIWLSPSDVASPLGEVPAIELPTGTTGQRIHIWARPDPDKTLFNWSLNLHSTDNGVIAFTGLDVYNPTLDLESVPGLPYARYQVTGNGRVHPAGVTGFTAFTTALPTPIGVGISEQSGPLDPYYDPANDAFLLASAAYDVVGPGTAELFLQVGDNGILNRGERTGDHRVVFGDPADPALTGEDEGRGRDSATADAMITGIGPPVLQWRQAGRITNAEVDEAGAILSGSADQLLVASNRSWRMAVYRVHPEGWEQTGTLALDLPWAGLSTPHGPSDAAISGQVAVAGAAGYGYASGVRGTAYLFEQTDSGWSVAQQLRPESPDAIDGFGQAVDVSNDRAVVTATAVDGGPGAAYVFDRSGGQWEFTAELAPTSWTDRDDFGETVALAGDRVAVGAPGNGRLEGIPGQVHLFERQGGAWDEAAVLEPGESQGGDRFGEALAFDGDLLVVGAPTDSQLGYRAGAAYVFERQDDGRLAEVARLAPENPVLGSEFGTSVSLAAGQIVVGAAGGLAYVFEQDGSNWQQTGLLYADDGDVFGASVVALDGQQVAVGAPGWDEPYISNAGAVYLFQARGVSAQSVPEPATLSLLVVGLLGWWSFRFK